MTDAARTFVRDFAFAEPIYVTHPVLPSLDAYRGLLETVWGSRTLTNNGVLHQRLEKKLAAYLGVKHVKVVCNGTIALVVALLRDLGNIIAGNPFGKRGLDALRQPALESLAAETAATLRPRSAISHYAFTAHCLDQMPGGVLKIVDTHDALHARQETARAAGDRSQGPTFTRAQEIDALNRADVLLPITPCEATTLYAMCPAKRVLLVNDAMSVHNTTPSPYASREALVVAGPDDQNVCGLGRFPDEAWPGVRKEHPTATLTLCGRVGESFKRLPEGVRCERVVENLDPYYTRAALIINPVLYGTGQAVKTIEALARGRALVCAPEGLRGLEHAGEVPCRVTRHGVEKASAVKELFPDAPKRHALERRATEFARMKFAPEVVYGPLLNIFGSPRGTSTSSPGSRP